MKVIMKQSFLSCLSTILLIVGVLAAFAGFIMVLVYILGSIVDGLNWFGWTYRSSADLGIQKENGIWGVILFIGGMALAMLSLKIDEASEK